MRGCCCHLPDRSNLRTPPPLVEKVIAAAKRYFAGEKIDFSDAVLDLGEQDELFTRIYDAARRVGYGQTTTYGTLAKQLGGDWEMAREVGQAMAKNPVPLIIPCHRVLAAGGKVGGFSAPGSAWNRRSACWNWKAFAWERKNPRRNRSASDARFRTSGGCARRPTASTPPSPRPTEAATPPKSFVTASIPEGWGQSTRSARLRKRRSPRCTRWRHESADARAAPSRQDGTQHPARGADPHARMRRASLRHYSWLATQKETIAWRDRARRRISPFPKEAPAPAPPRRHENLPTGTAQRPRAVRAAATPAPLSSVVNSSALISPGPFPVRPVRHNACPGFWRERTSGARSWLCATQSRRARCERWNRRGSAPVASRRRERFLAPDPRLPRGCCGDPGKKRTHGLWCLSMSRARATLDPPRAAATSAASSSGAIRGA